jgi:hypothetical protein
MSQQEVTDAVGAPPGDYSRDRRGRDYQLHYDPRRSWWITDDAELIVDFDSTGTAIGVVVGDVTHPPPTLTERIRRWLGL